MENATFNIIDDPTKRNIVLYKPNNQNIGIAKNIEITTANIVKSFISTNFQVLDKMQTKCLKHIFQNLQKSLETFLHI